MNSDMEKWAAILRKELPYEVTNDQQRLATMQVFYSLQYHQRAKELWQALKTAKSKTQFQGLLKEAVTEFPVREDWNKPVYPFQFKQTLLEAVLLRYKQRTENLSLSAFFRSMLGG